MIELFTKIDFPKLFSTTNLEKETMADFDSNLVYVELDDKFKLSKIQLLNENSIVGDFENRMKNIPFFNTILQKINNEIKKRGSIYKNEIYYETFSKNNIMKTKGQHSNGIKLKYDGTSNVGNASIDGAGGGSNCVSIPCVYMAKDIPKGKKDLNEVVLYRIERYFDLYKNQKSISEIKNRNNEQSTFITDQEITNIGSVQLNRNNFTQLLLDDTKPTIIIYNLNLSNYKNFDIDKVKEKLFESYINTPKLFTPLKSISTGTCRICNSKQNLISSPYFSEESETTTHIFNLENKKTNKKFETKSNYLCTKCHNDIEETYDFFETNKISYFKMRQNNFNQYIEKIENLSDLSFNSNLNYNNIFVVKSGIDSTNSLKNIKRIEKLFVIEKTAKNTKQNFHIVNEFLDYPQFRKEDTKKWSSNFADVFYKEKYPKNKYEIEKEKIIKDTKKTLMDFWFYDKNIENRIVVAYLNLFLKHLHSVDFRKGNGYFHIYNIFSLYDKENKMGKDSTICKIKGVKMKDLHENINEKIKIFENNDSELEVLELTDSEYWILFGRVMGYLKTKSKESEPTLDYLTHLNTKQQIQKRLLDLFNKYGYEISNKQVKFKMVFSYLLEEFKNKNFAENNKIEIVSGALNSKIIKLIKEKDNK